MSVFIRGKKASHLAVGGKSLSKAWHNGKLIFKNGIRISCYGFLTYNTEDRIGVVTPIVDSKDYNKLFASIYGGALNKTLNFSFGSVLRDNITGWEFSQDPATSYVGNSIGEMFLGGCKSLNSKIRIPDWVTTVGAGFLNQCTSFNSDIDFNNVTSLPNTRDDTYQSTLSGCTAFNANITANKVTSIGNGFMLGCTAFNKDVSFPLVTSIGDNFMSNCKNFNKSINLPLVRTIGNFFMYGWNLFNQEFTLPVVETIGTNFLAGSSGTNSFNKVITIPATCSSIGSGMLQGRVNYNNIIDLPENITLGGIMNVGNGGVYNKTFTIKPGMTMAGQCFYGIADMTVVCESHPDNITCPSDNSFMFYGLGSGSGTVTFIGTYKNEMAAKYPTYSDGLKKRTTIIGDN